MKKKLGKIIVFNLFRPNILLEVLCTIYTENKTMRKTSQKLSNVALSAEAILFRDQELLWLAGVSHGLVPSSPHLNLIYVALNMDE